MSQRPGSSQYLKLLGIENLPASTFAFDPGCSPEGFASHLVQSSHLLCGVKLSMGTWQIGSTYAVRTKIESIRRAGLEATAGGGSFEVAAVFGLIREYLAHAAYTGFDCVEVGEGFTAEISRPEEVVLLAHEHGLKVKYELGKKFEGALRNDGSVCDRVRRWLAAGAEQIVIEAREDAVDVGIFNAQGELNRPLADILVNCVEGEFRLLQFEAPTKLSQFALIEHFGPQVVLGNVRLEEVLRVEVFRRGLHSRSFAVDRLRPKGPGL